MSASSVLTLTGLGFDIVGALLLAGRLLSGVRGLGGKVRLFRDALLGRATAGDVAGLALQNQENAGAALRGLSLIVFGFLFQLAGLLVSATAG